VLNIIITIILIVQSIALLFLLKQKQALLKQNEALRKKAAILKHSQAYAYQVRWIAAIQMKNRKAFDAITINLPAAISTDSPKIWIKEVDA
jgi:hypothetical protein